MSKKPPVGPEFSKDREFTAVLEDLRSEFRVFGEGLSAVQEKVEKIDERLANVESDVAVIKSAIPTLATKQDLQKLEKRILTVESR